ncbi:mCG145925, partial [Mus musculus]
RSYYLGWNNNSLSEVLDLQPRGLESVTESTSRHLLKTPGLSLLCSNSPSRPENYDYQTEPQYGFQILLDHQRNVNRASTQNHLQRCQRGDYSRSSRDEQSCDQAVKATGSLVA